MGSPHAPNQPAYRPVPSPPRMRWAVVPRPWFWRMFSAAFGSALVCCVMNRGLGWVYAALTSFAWPALLCLVGLRPIRVPVEPPQVRVADNQWHGDDRVHRDFVVPLLEFEASLRAAREAGASGPDDEPARQEDRRG